MRNAQNEKTRNGVLRLNGVQKKLIVAHAPEALRAVCALVSLGYRFRKVLPGLDIAVTATAEEILNHVSEAVRQK